VATGDFVSSGGAPQSDRPSCLESGLIAAALVAQDGASRYFRGGFVFYTLEAMATQLADASDVEFGERSATEQRARWGADCARVRLAADWGVGETGAAGPRPNLYGDPAGHSWVAAARPDGIVSAHVLTGDRDRLANMEARAPTAADDRFRLSDAADRRSAVATTRSPA
jgi:nicotinamide-nucleotide amidase